MEELKRIYSTIKHTVENRIKEFNNIKETADNKAMLKEMVFCLMTPQSKAKTCAKVTDDIFTNDYVFKASVLELSNAINNVRFKNNKAKYIKEAIAKFKNRDIKKTINNFNDVYEARDWLVKNIKGYGYKEASHFLRNTGFGYDLAILDRHILKNLKNYGVLKEIPKTINEKTYKTIEKDMQNWAKEINIPMHHLDFVLWYKETKEVFK